MKKAYLTQPLYLCHFGEGIKLTNTILWNNTAGTGDTMYNATITAVITNSLIQGGIDGSGIYNADSSSSIIDGGGVIDADPTFVDAENGNLRLIEQSVAVDAGINSAVSVLLDLDGEQRISNGIVDMGAYEFQFPRIMTVTFTGTGTGLVNSNGIGYTDSFIEEFTRTIPVTLTAVADPGSFFTGWGGECYGIGNCLITMTESKEIIANFDIVPPGEQALSVFNIGEGVGTVTSIPVGIDCGLDCTETYSENSVITLTAMSEPGSFFTGWSGACTGTGDCIVTIEAATQVTATFALMQYDLSLSWRGTGEGHIVSDPAGINCDGACAASFSHGTLVTLTAVPATNSSFDGWGGACTDASGLVCTLTIEGETGVSATFTKIEYNIYLPTITKGN